MIKIKLNPVQSFICETGEVLAILDYKMNMLVIKPECSTDTVVKIEELCDLVSPQIIFNMG